MPDIGFENVTELATIVVELLLAVALTAVGVAAEAAGAARLAAGVDPLTIWYVFVGALALYAGVYMLGIRSLLPQLRA